MSHPSPNHDAAGRHAPRHSLLSFLEALQADQHEALAFGLDDAERLNWHYVPRDRRGLPLKAMTPTQRSLHRSLLSEFLSERGMQKVAEVILLERVLGELTGNRDFRDPGKYYASGFFSTGRPEAAGVWGWRFEGHHLSLNYVVIDGAVVAATPAFFGANPARVPSGPHAGLRVLAEEEDLGRRLLKALPPGQRDAAVLSRRAPRDILTGADRQVGLERLEGVPASAMDPEPRALLADLIRLYLGNQSPAWADRMWRELEAAGWEHVHFAWAGGLEPGDGHYYRIHGPTILIEYDNTQNGANHIHAVLRDPRGDFGLDPLRRHYEDPGGHH